jgi:hypothetical protein
MEVVVAKGGGELRLRLLRIWSERLEKRRRISERWSNYMAEMSRYRGADKLAYQMMPSCATVEEGEG